MARIEVITHVEAPPERVWEVLVDWEGQARWMADVSHVEVLSERREGTGVRVRCRTNILGTPLNDDLEVTEWSPDQVLGVRHLGRLIRGIAAFELQPTAYGTRVLWWEEAEAPLGAVGDAFAGIIIVPWVARMFRRNLSRLKRVCEDG